MARVAWRLAVPCEVTTEYASTSIRDYYQSGETMWRTQEMARTSFQALYGVELGGPRVDVPAYVGVAALGADLHYPKDDPPQIRGHSLHSPEEAARLALPDSYVTTVAMRPFLGIQRWMQTRAGEGWRVRLGTGIEGPITSAKLLRGQEFFLDLYTAPALAHRLLDLVTDSIIRFSQEVRRCNGVVANQGGAGIADDFAGLISPAMWPEFVIPYYHRIYNAFGEGPRSHHSELLRPAHLHFLLELGVTSFDPGQDQYLSIADIQRAAPGLPFIWNLKTVRHLCQGTPATIRGAFEEAVTQGATTVMAELCRGTPPENVRAFVEVARRFACDA